MPSWIWTSRAGLIALALLLDRLVGDPPWLPHPVQLFGWLIARGERLLNHGSEHARRARGVLLVALLVTGVAAISELLSIWLARIPAGRLLLCWLMSTTLAVHSLRRHALQVHRPLIAGDLVKARHYTGHIVGRDTADLSEQEVVRAVVETVAENASDGVIAPLFYLLCFGLPGAMVYKLINTLDSMLGHKTPALLHFGWAAARLDDLANYLPARLAALLLVPVAWLLGADARLCWRCIRRDARKHASPNSGWLEAGFAGALQVQLGGLNYYQGVPDWHPYLGEPLQALTAQQIGRSLRLMQALSYSFALIGLAILGVSG